MYYAKPLARLIGELERLPGVGTKSAQRFALHMLRHPDAARLLAQAILEVGERISSCSVCFNYTDQELCEICSSDRRDRGLLCVVAEPRDVIALEKTNEYPGLYHVLGGVISPQESIGPDLLRIKDLIERVGREDIREVILALNPTVEGTMTTFFIEQRLRPLSVKLSQLAFGLPVGGDLDYADQATLIQALEGRREL